MVLEREDSSWLVESCCPAGEKGADVDEAAEDLRLPTRREVAGGSEGKPAVAGEYAGCEAPGEGVLRWSCATAVVNGGRRVLWLCLGAPQGCCWLIEMACPWAARGRRGGGEGAVVMGVRDKVWHAW